jgi:hypothetical protein
MHKDTETTLCNFCRAVNAGVKDTANRTGATGASLHAAVMGHNTGETYTVTGPFPPRTYSSAAAAYASYRAAWASRSIWRVTPEGRRLVLR